MVYSHMVNAYRRSEKQAEIHPVRLIHMMYERILTHLQYAEAGIKEGNPKKRGENLGKAIALITELNASIKQDDESEAAHFLRGLYNSILMELPKVSVSGKVDVLRQTARYIKELKKIWEETAMIEHGFAAADKETTANIEKHLDTANTAAAAFHGVSVSI